MTHYTPEQYRKAEELYDRMGGAPGRFGHMRPKEKIAWLDAARKMLSDKI